MWFARLLVGLVAGLIALAGVGWYAVYLFTPDPRTRNVAPEPTLGNASLPARPQTPYERRQNKRTVWMGIAAAIGGLVLIVQAVDSIRTGVPIQTLNESPTNGWVALAAAVFVIILGLWLAAAGLGLVRMRNPPISR
jgi:hypothetical protein